MKSSLDFLMGYSPNDLLTLPEEKIPPQTKSKNEYKRIALQPIHKLKLWRLRPWYFFEEVLDMKLDKWQRKFVESFLENDRTVVIAYRDWETDRKSTRLNSSHSAKSRMPSSA